MSSLYNKKVRETFPDLLTVLGSSVGEGLTTSAKRIFDGDGTGSALLLSTTTLQVDGTLNLKEQSSEPSNPSVGDLAFINDDLYIANKSNWKSTKFLKSHLQKCIRRKKTKKAIQTAYHLLELDPVNYLSNCQKSYQISDK